VPDRRLSRHLVVVQVEWFGERFNFKRFSQRRPVGSGNESETPCLNRSEPVFHALGLPFDATWLVPRSGPVHCRWSDDREVESIKSNQVPFKFHCLASTELTLNIQPRVEGHRFIFQLRKPWHSDFALPHLVVFNFLFCGPILFAFSSC
jgi:hypothetical protein